MTPDSYYIIESPGANVTIHLDRIEEREILWKRLDILYDRMIHCPDYTQTTGDRIDQNIDDYHEIIELRIQLGLREVS